MSSSMDAGVMAVHVYSRKPLPSFDYPYLPLTTTADLVAALPSSRPTRHDVQRRHNDTVLAVFSGSAPGTSSARVPEAFEVTSSNALSQHIPVSASPYSFPVTPSLAGANERGDCNGPDGDLVDDPAPPPVPPKSPVQARPKSLKAVSILAPTDISPAPRVSSHSVSDTGHASWSSSNFAQASPEGAPAYPMSISSQHRTAPASVAGLSFSSDACLSRHSGMETVNRNTDASSTRDRRNRLHKARPRPPSPSLNLSSSVFSLLLSRTRGSEEPLSGQHRSSSTPSMGDRYYRPTRSLSDGNSKVHSARPIPSSRSSETAESSYTASSSASTSFSYPSTTLTTPDSSSPGLSPRNSTRTNKLHKKRPPLAPSAYQYPPGAHTSALGRSKSTPNGLGQRMPRHRLWSNVGEARRSTQEVDGPGQHEPTLWCASPSDSSPSRRSMLGPILEVRKKTSSQALSDLACTGLCSSSVAAHASQLALTADSLEQLDTFNIHDWHDSRMEHYDPYAECASPPASVALDSTHDTFEFPPAARSRTSSQDETQTKTGESGFSVVHGYLDRSEDAMRRWTLAMADVPDDVLVQHLERLRKESAALARGRLPGRRSAAPSQIGHGDDELTVDTRGRRSSFFFGGPREMGISPRSASHARFSVGHYDPELEDGDDSDEEALSDEEDEEDWKTARQVLFCCRELVQTERNYQARLRELASTELSHHYASLVSRFIPALLRVSETLLAHLIDDPSAWGVSAAFIACEEELETAFVAWTSVVGEFFLEDANLRPPRKLKKLLDEPSFSPTNDGHTSTFSRVMRTRSQVGIASPARHSMSFSGRRLSSAMSDIGHGETYSNVGHHEGAGMFTAALGTGLPYGVAVPAAQSPDTESPSGKSSKHGGLARIPTVSSTLGLSRAMTAWKRRSMPSSVGHIPSMLPTSPGTSSPYHRAQSHAASAAHGGRKGAADQESKMSVRDLAIQPTQRVMRYVLQYRDLLDHTPATSPSRPLVERAYESALRIAKKCDRAQAHASFLRQTVTTNQNQTKSDKHAAQSVTTSTT